MKKVISLLLAVIMAFSVLAVSVAAEGGDYQTHLIIYDIGNEHIHINPIEGYDKYVFPGDDFKFTVTVDEGYSKFLTVVDVDQASIEPDVHGVYTIPEVNSDMTITVYFTSETAQTNIFSSLVILLHDIYNWLKNIIDTIIQSNKT